MKKVFLLLSVGMAFVANAQFSGNAAYKRDRYSRDDNFSEKRNVVATDSTVVFYTDILLNQRADNYKLTLGVRQEGKTPAEALKKINERINGFAKSIRTLASAEDIFVDFITQNRILDFDIDKQKETAKQKVTGYEIKKNVIISLKNYSDIEQVILQAAEHQIYDVIKVDYINTDIAKIRKQLLSEAYQISEEKKKDYFSHFKKEILGSPVAESDFHYLFPSSRYEEYTVSESSKVDVPSRYTEEYLRKEDTYYYEGVDYSGFDKVINPTHPEVGIQYILRLRVKYKIKK